MEPSAKKEWVYLAPKPGSHYRQLVVKGRNIFAISLYSPYVWEGEHHMTPEEIAEDYDVPLAVVLEAIAYCESNPPEIREDWEMEQALAEARGMNDPNYKYNPQPKALPPEEIARLYRLYRR